MSRIRRQINEVTMAQIFTIGYTAFPNPSDFVATLKQHNISCVIDVRSYPVASSFFATYSKDLLEPLLKKQDIVYRNYAKEFGARQENRAYFMKDGCLDFGQFVKSDEFLSGFQKIEKILQSNHNFALMCAEKDPIDCHRTIMIGRALDLLGFDVCHILADGSLSSQRDIDERLLKIYHLDEANLFQTRDELICEAYVCKNIQIGYRGKEEKAI